MGSFHHHFADKAALNDRVTEDLSADLLAEVRPSRLETTLTTASFRPELSEPLDRIDRIATTHPQLMDLERMFHNSAEVSAERGDRASARHRDRLGDRCAPSRPGPRRH